MGKAGWIYGVIKPLCVCVLCVCVCVCVRDGVLVMSSDDDDLCVMVCMYDGVYSYDHTTFQSHKESDSLLKWASRKSDTLLSDWDESWANGVAALQLVNALEPPRDQVGQHKEKTNSISSNHLSKSYIPLAACWDSLVADTVCLSSSHSYHASSPPAHILSGSSARPASAWLRRTL